MPPVGGVRDGRKPAPLVRHAPCLPSPLPANPALPLQSMSEGQLRTRIKRITNLAKLKSFITVSPG